MKHTIYKCLALGFSCVLLLAPLTGCGAAGSKSAEKSYTLLDVAEPGKYNNVLDNRTDYLEVTADGKLSLKEFDENELVSFYGDAMQNANITEQQFLDLLHNPYEVTVKAADIEGCYKIALPLFGPDAQMSFVLDYDSETKNINFHSCDYQKAEAAAQN